MPTQSAPSFLQPANKTESGWAVLEPPRRPNRLARFIRLAHFWLGAVFTLNFLLLVITGLLVQHREAFGLESHAISRRWLPAAYRPQDPDSEVRADIVLTDLHSGNIFGPHGPLVVDTAAAAWLLMMATGYGVKLVCRYRNRNV